MDRPPCQGNFKKFPVAGSILHAPALDLGATPRPDGVIIFWRDVTPLSVLVDAKNSELVSFEIMMM